MGFVAPTAVFPLSVRNPALEGLEVWMSRPSVATIGDMMLLGGLDPKSMTIEDVKRLNNIFDAFAKNLKRWNVQEQVLDDQGHPTEELRDVPATREGVESLDGNFLLLVILAWVETVTGLAWDTNKVATIPMQTQE